MMKLETLRQNADTENGAFLPEEKPCTTGSEGHEPSRDKWSNRLEFILANIGFTVGIGTIWRFPTLFARNGGGAFLIPFCLVLMLIGLPLYHLEVNLGQFTGQGPCAAFEFCPLFKGTGFLMVTTLFIVLWYNMTVMSWILYFLYNSFSAQLPWSTCGNEWNTDLCRGVDLHVNVSSRNTTGNVNMTGNVSTHISAPALEFWLHNVLGKSSGLEDMGHLQPHLVICLAVGYTITIACLVKGVRSLGKVVYFTVTFPYVLLTILLIRAITLDGSLDGIAFCFQFRGDKLADPQVWLDASVMAFYSLGPIWGTVILTASHNRFNQPNFRDTVTICVADTLTTLYAAVVVFAIIGFVAREQGVAVEELASASGPGLAFVAYPTAVTMMPLPQLWAVLFFLMLILVMLDSAFTMVEVCASTLVDFLPKHYERYQLFVTLGFCLFLFLSGLIYTTNGGIYLFQLIDWYSTAFGLLFGAFFEVTSLALIYGIDRFSKDIALMGGARISRPFRILYCVVIPIATLVTFVLMLAQYKKPTYGDGYVYKPYAIAVGICVGLIPIAVFLGVAIRSVVSQEGNIYQKLKMSIRPSKKWGPQDTEAAIVYKTTRYLHDDSIFKRLKTSLMGTDNASPT